MEVITVAKDKILPVLKKNREGHRAIFLEAVEGYKKEAIRMLEATLEKVKKGKLFTVSVGLPLPQDHTRDYDRAIAMIEMDEGNTVELSEADFQCYIQDDWDWKMQFLASNSRYSSTATAMLAQMPD